MNEPIKIWDNNHGQLVQELMDEIPLDASNIVRRVITTAYAAGYEPFSDGITGFPQLDMQEYSIKHPIGVAHDWLYFQGVKNPFIPFSTATTEYSARAWADEWFDLACKAFGHPIYASTFWTILRIGGWKAWNNHRRAGHPEQATYDVTTGRLIWVNPF